MAPVTHVAKSWEAKFPLGEKAYLIQDATEAALECHRRMFPFVPGDESNFLELFRGSHVEIRKGGRPSRDDKGGGAPFQKRRQREQRRVEGELDLTLNGVGTEG